MNKARESHKCRACRRPLTSAVSIRYGYGPDCLRKAAKAGNVPMEALEEFTAWKKANPKPRPTKQKASSAAPESLTHDLFAALREAALDDLNKAVTVCESVGLTIKIEIQ